MNSRRARSKRITNNTVKFWRFNKRESPYADWLKTNEKTALANARIVAPKGIQLQDLGFNLEKEFRSSPSGSGRVRGSSYNYYQLRGSFSIAVDKTCPPGDYDVEIAFDDFLSAPKDPSGEATLHAAPKLSMRVKVLEKASK